MTASIIDRLNRVTSARERLLFSINIASWSRSECIGLYASVASHALSNAIVNVLNSARENYQH
jgi:hypothetical protein